MSVSNELHAAVRKRDGRCFLSRYAGHVCRDTYGAPHDPDDLAKLTVDHVHMGGAMMGKRAPDDERHLVAMCAQSNVAGPSRAVREAERAYLARLYP